VVAAAFAMPAMAIVAVGLAWPAATPAPTESSVSLTEKKPTLYPPVSPGASLEFPRDEGSHPEFRTEWWYVTGWIEDAEAAEAAEVAGATAAKAASEPLGFQVTFFRVRSGLGETNPSRFAPRQILFAHAAIADPRLGRLRHAERSVREGFDLAYARSGRTDVRIDDWTITQDGDRYRAVVVDDTVAVDGALELDLTLTRTQPPLLQGDRGYSRKSPATDAASYYYSHPQLAVRGRVTVAGRAREVTGTAWFDHEWSSQVLDPAARGWDWTGINFADGGALMAFQMRSRSGGAPLWAAATYRAPAGEVTTFGPGEVSWQPTASPQLTASAQPPASWQSPRTGAKYPVRWRVRAGGGLDLELAPLLDDAELDSRASTGAIYWEGPVRALDSKSRAELGRGYLELTGYAAPIEF
jgi:predicted secreted hydrolase